jgi:uncharacterized coiled-coil DUF342 family protein
VTDFAYLDARQDAFYTALNNVSRRIDLVSDETDDYGEILYVVLDRCQSLQRRLDDAQAYVVEQDKRIADLTQRLAATEERLNLACSRLMRVWTGRE